MAGATVRAHLLKAKGFCATKGCSARVSSGHCLAHTKARQQVSDIHRGSARQRGYTTRWDTFSKAWLARFPWCGQRADGQRYALHSRCVQAQQWTLAEVTDHIVPLSQGGTNCDEANSQSLCRRCNTAKGDR